MDIKEIQDLIKFVAKSGVSEVELETKGVKIRICTAKEVAYVQAPVVAPQVVNVPAVQTPVVQQNTTPANSNTPPVNTGSDDSK